MISKTLTISKCHGSSNSCYHAMQQLSSKEVPNVSNVSNNKINLPKTEVDVKIQIVHRTIENKEKSPTKNIPSQEEVAILFLQELLQDFENILTITEDFKGFDKYATDWMRNYIEENMKRTKVEYIFEVLLKFYQDNHLEYFSSLLGFFYQYGIGHKINKKKALEMYKITTMQDNLGKNIYNHLQNINKSVGEYLLALYYYKDIIVDKQKSLKWSYKPAKEGNTASQYEIGYCYEYGIGTIQSDKKAFDWYMKSAMGDNPKGQCSLAWCYQQGIGVEKDDEKSFEWYLKSAKGGNINGQCNLAYYYENGIGTEKDEGKAFEWYEKSAQGGNTFGQNSLGYFYEMGVGTSKNPVKAIEWYTKSAKRGHHIGQFNLGRCYHDGIGVEKDTKKAFEWLLKSAKSGNSQGQYHLERYFNIKVKSD
ncbi:1780_t:CDS:2 [Funneliformis geosporum]|uniref:1780_t:CDS:1 n=1 Tax=Funneliformis geosporum TaxID=1117311 RepID=A0A9W4SF75_9GLOM|nr:1780_t:CDS:2 [Funneliformis geosporum]